MTKECHRCGNQMKLIHRVLSSVYQCGSCHAEAIHSELDFSKVTIDLDEITDNENKQWTFS
jgi:DNA-directed RNA polymerase subunit M/transcription elongation factor TFIIS